MRARAWPRGRGVGGLRSRRGLTVAATILACLAAVTAVGCTTRTDRPPPDLRFDGGGADRAIPEFGCGTEFCTFEEECDGIDSDLDGLVDENGIGQPMSQFCVAACGQGVRVCLDGRFGPCIEPEPAAEVGAFACDSVDNDCDGAIDEERFAAGDVLVLLDVSGSMSGFIYEVVSNLRAVEAARPDWRFAIATFPSETSSDVTLVADFGAPMPELTTVGTPDEPSYDALAAAAEDTLGASWNPGAARFIVLVTDEPGQSYAHPPIVERTACDRFRRGETVLSFASYAAHFDACGATYPIGTLSTLADALADPCEER